MEDDRNSLDCMLDELEKESVGSGEDGRQTQGSEVYLNVYDMIWVNEYVSRLGIGAFHTGIQIHGREYAYGGHPYSYTGVYEMGPKQEDDIAGQGVKFKQTLHLGHTAMTLDEVKELVHTLGKQYNGNSYHIIYKNCNHFSSELSLRLCGTHIPHWINRLAYVSSWMPFVVNCLPPSWVTPGDASNETTTNRMLYSSCSKSQSQSHSHSRDSSLNQEDMQNTT